MKHKAFSLLGLCMRAGKLSNGEFAALAAIRENIAKLIILAEDAAENTKKKFQNAAEYYHIPILVWGSKEELGNALGKDDRAIITVNEEGFANKIKMYYEQK